MKTQLKQAISSKEAEINQLKAATVEHVEQFQKLEAEKTNLETNITQLNVQHSVETEALENRITKQEESYTALQTEKEELAQKLQDANRESEGRIDSEKEE